MDILWITLTKLYTRTDNQILTRIIESLLNRLADDYWQIIWHKATGE